MSPTGSVRGASSKREEMRGRSINGRLIATLLIGLVGLGLAAVGFTAAGEPTGEHSTRGRYRGSEPPARFMLPVFELESSRGALVRSRALKGKVVLLTILDSQCEDACPTLAAVVARTIDRLTTTERQTVRALGISGDPVEDTPAAVRRFLTKRRAVGRLDYLVGAETRLRPLWNALQILPSLDSGKDNLHSAPLRVYNPEGIWVATLHAGVDLSEENLLHNIRLALTKPAPKSD